MTEDQYNDDDDDDNIVKKEGDGKKKSVAFKASSSSKSKSKVTLYYNRIIKLYLVHPIKASPLRSFNHCVPRKKHTEICLY